MKVLSMIQPWASLFVLHEAKYETRTWRTNYRGPLEIHTSKKIDKAVCNHVAIQALLGKHGYTKENLPTGMIIAVCKLENCLMVTENNQTSAILEDGRIVSGNDYFLGDFEVGGFAWEVQDMQILDEFIPAKGKLGLWEYKDEERESLKKLLGTTNKEEKKSKSKQKGNTSPGKRNPVRDEVGQTMST